MTATTTVGTDFDQLRAWAQAELLARAPDHIQRLHWSPQQIDAAQREGLRALLAHAIEHSPFHRRRLGGIDPSRFEPPDLAHLPVMTKAEMMASLDDGLPPLWWTFRMSRAQPEENVHDDHASETLLYTRVQGADG